MADVRLVSMPFGAIFSPSIALSLLKPQLQRRGLTCEITYLTLPYAELIGQGLYSTLATDRRGSMQAFAGEWLFSDELFSRTRADERAYVRDILRERATWARKAWARPMTSARIAAILGAKRHVPGFLDACLRRVLEGSPRIVGFTSVFQQQMGSLALAKRIKAARPETVIVIGGANCESVMGAETLRQYPFVDAIVSGEADVVFPEFARRVVDGRPWNDLPGVLGRAGLRSAFAFRQFPTAPPVTDMDALPFPDYSDYFEQFERSAFGRDWQPGVFIETSRGCWWGERMHCTFCGLNGGTMKYRSKSAERAYSEFAHLARAHPGASIQVVDNILDLAYFNTLLPILKDRKLRLELFYETKSNLKKPQIRLLRESGVTMIQPGIESFSDQVLKLMKKGVSGLQNIQLLKWCKQFGVMPMWNLLFGFPGESPEEYHRMTAIVPDLMHLPGPRGFGPIRIDRFSPNYFDAEKHGFTNLRPLPAYEFVHDVRGEALHNLAYHFAYDYQQPTDVAGYVRRLLPRLKQWRTAWARYELLAVDDNGVLVLIDTRPRARAPLTVLTGADRDLYLACDAITDVDSACRAVPSIERTAIRARLEAMVGRGVMVSDGNRFVALAVPLGEYASTGAAAAGVFDLLRRIGTRSGASVHVPLDRPEYQLSGPAGGRQQPRMRAVRRRAAVRLRRTDVRIRRNELRVRRSVVAT
jgi:ribosomal peptide maturation radical SAM protein 1